jgi:phenylpropionate dioxygenase-like ring-hydroxylating dioxygenase large terminal subunit
MNGGTVKSVAHLEPTLAGKYYCDPAILEQEWERIFYPSWLCAVRDERLPEPGSYITLPIGHESILIVRDKERNLRAYYNVCRHRGAQLCSGREGRLEGAVRCSYHGWTYSLDGRLIGTPHFRRVEGFSRTDFPLYPVALEVWGGFVFVNLEADRAAALAEQLGDIPERVRRYPLSTLQSGAVRVHEVECNWKILVENYMECYHCPGVHPELCDLVPLYRTGEVDAQDGETAYFREGAVTFTRGGTTRRPLMSGLNDEERRKYNGEMILPNMMLNLFPDYAHVRTLWPLGPGRTRILSQWLFEPATVGSDDFDPTDAVEFIDMVSRQDWDVCEAVQRGVGSRAHRHGVYTPQETHAAGFKRWFLERFEASG